ncbi:MAG: translocation/assembly module TamB domain-containing protein [Bacteroidales bacterium]
MARNTTLILSNQWNTPVKVQAVKISPFGSIQMKGVNIYDYSQNNLCSFDLLDVQLKYFDLVNKSIHLSSVVGKKIDFDLVKRKGDEDLNLIQIVNYFTGKQGENDTTSSIEPNQIDLKCDLLQLIDTRFHYQDENRPPSEDDQMDYSNLDINDINLTINNLHIEKDTFNFTVSSLSCYDRCGFKIQKMSGDFRLSSRFLHAKNLLVQTPQADLDLDLFFDYKRWYDYTEFLDDIYIRARVRKSSMNLAQIGYFADVMYQMNDSLSFSGDIAGPVSNFRARDFYFKYGKVTEFAGDLQMNGLPNIYETFIHADIKKFYTNKSDVENFSLPIDETFIMLPEQLAKFGDLDINGFFTGFYNDFVTQASFNTGLGLLETDILLKNIQPGDSIYYQGNIKATNFDLGGFLDLKKYFGKLNLNSKIKGTGITPSTFSLNIDGEVDSWYLLQNKFNNVKIAGNLTSEKFNGNLFVDDQLLGLNFDGKVDFSNQEPEFDFRAIIKNARLNELGFTNRDTTNSFSSNLTISFIGDELDDIEGHANIDSTYYVEGDKSYFLDRFALVTLKDTARFKRIILQSDFADVNIVGNFLFKELVQSFKKFANNSVTIFDDKSMNSVINSQQLEFDVKLKDIRNLTEIFMPSLFLANNTDISGAYDSYKGTANLLFRTDSLCLNGVKFKDFRINGFADDNQVDLITRTERLALKDQTVNDSLAIGLDSLFFQVRASQDTLKYQFSWGDTATIVKNKADIFGYLNYKKDGISQFQVDQSKLLIKGDKWEFLPENNIEFQKGLIDFQRFGLKSSEQSFVVDGKISSHVNDTLSVSFQKWKISNLNPLTLTYGVDLAGNLQGKVNIFKENKLYEFTGDLTIDTLVFNKVTLGRFDIKSFFNKKNSSIDLQSQLIKQGNLGDSKVFDLSGSYFPNKIEDNIDFRASMRNMDLVLLNPLLKGLVSDIEGLSSGEVNIVGSLNKPQIIGDVRFSRSQLRIDYLNVPYSISGQAKLVPNKINLENIVLYDSISNRGTVDGFISHRFLRDWNFNIGVNLDNISAFNTSRSQNDIFYGRARASGRVDIKGPLDRISIDIKAKTNKDTDVSIPINLVADVSANKNIVFVNKADSAQLQKNYRVNLDGLALSLEIEVTPDASVQIYLPYNTGSIQSVGEGNLKLGLSRDGEFSMLGEYTINQGIFIFRFLNILYRKLKILQGGRIVWTGSPYDADVNIKAEYDLKASLAGLGLDSENASSQINRRTQVNAYLGLKNKLFNPDLHFGISLPNLDERTQQQIFSIIDTTNQDAMQKQVLSLLALGSFSYNNFSVGVGSNSLNLISSQLSNWLSQLSNDFDIGINYRPGDELSSQEVELALSTQLFDNRVTIDGNFGISERRTTQNSSNLVGDVNIEVKLTRDGRFRLRAFNRSNDNTLYSLSPFEGVSENTQGVGLSYTKEFDKFSDLFKWLKRKKKKRKETSNNKHNTKAILKEE